MSLGSVWSQTGDNGDFIGSHMLPKAAKILKSELFQIVDFHREW